MCAAHVAFTLAMEVMPTSHRVIMMVAVQGFWTVGTVAEVGTPLQQPPVPHQPACTVHVSAACWTSAGRLLLVCSVTDGF